MVGYRRVLLLLRSLFIYALCLIVRMQRHALLVDYCAGYYVGLPLYSPYPLQHTFVVGLVGSLTHFYVCCLLRFPSLPILPFFTTFRLYLFAFVLQRRMHVCRIALYLRRAAASSGALHYGVRYVPLYVAHFPTGWFLHPYRRCMRYRCRFVGLTFALFPVPHTPFTALVGCSFIICAFPCAFCWLFIRSVYVGTFYFVVVVSLRCTVKRRFLRAPCLPI